MYTCIHGYREKSLYVKRRKEKSCYFVANGFCWALIFRWSNLSGRTFFGIAWILHTENQKSIVTNMIKFCKLQVLWVGNDYKADGQNFCKLRTYLHHILVSTVQTCKPMIQNNFEKFRHIHGLSFTEQSSFDIYAQ